MNLKIVLEDLDFADDIALPSSKCNDLREKTWRLTEEAARVSLKLIARKCKTMRAEFVYLGAIVDKEGGGSRDIRNRLQTIRGAFQRL